LSSDGRFIAINTVGSEMSGEPTGDVATFTWQFAVPPRISGP
jgi:hypothetical protein